jgi:hypothetical protein
MVDNELDDRFREAMHRCYLPLAAGGLPPRELIRFSTAAYCLAPLVRRVVGDTGAMTAVETGTATHWLFAKHYLSAIFGKSLVPIGRRARRLPLSEMHEGSRSRRERGRTLAEAVLTRDAGRLILPPTQTAGCSASAVATDGGAPFLSYGLGWLRRARLPTWQDLTIIELPHPSAGCGGQARRRPRCPPQRVRPRAVGVTVTGSALSAPRPARRHGADPPPRATWSA